LFFEDLKNGRKGSVPISKVIVVSRSASFKKDYTSRIPFGNGKTNQASFYLQYKK